jgi:WD40 repeat protein/tRNA A-37 threonylcarbamoyl transferase component Bud32
MTLDWHEDGEPDAVDSIVADYLDTLDRGQAPARAEWLARHAEHAEELGRFLDDLESLSPHRHPTANIHKDTFAPSSISSPRSLLAKTQGLEATLAHRITSATTLATGIPSSDFGEYELLEVIARGGMGIVFKARHKKLERVVALKMILAGQLASEHDIQRFRLEAQAAGRLDHPGIVPIYEVGEEQGLHYFTMALVEGSSLAERLSDGPLPPRTAARLARDLAGAIQFAHQNGIIHRDLKPANILLDRQDQPKLTDFGLAKRVDDANNMTGTGQILGTPTCMSPEQAAGDSRNIGPASDVYGLGALLFAMLTGRPPFQAATPLETLVHVISVEPTRPRALNPSVPRDLETICLKCLEKSPGKRYATAAALAEDLDRFLNDHPIQARPAGKIEKAYRWYRRRPVIGTMAAALALLLIAVPLLLAGLWQEAKARADVEAAGHKKEVAAREKEASARQKEAEARRKIEVLERERTRQLFQAYANEAAARRASPRVGRRFEAIDRILAARALADELQLAPEEYTRLRSEAVSALSLTDLRTTTTGPGWACRVEPPLFRHASGKDCYLDWDAPDGLLVRRLEDNRVVQRLAGVDRGTSSPRLSRDNRHVAILSKAKLVVWRVDGDRPKEVLRRDKVQFASFAPDRAEMVLLVAPREIVVQPLEGEGKPKSLRVPELQKEPLKQLLAAAGRRVAVARSTDVSIVDLDAGNVTAFCALPAPVSTMAWSHDGALLAIACAEHSIIFYHPASNSRRVLKGPLGGAMRLAFDPSDRVLLSYSVWGGRGILWNVANATPELRFTPPQLPPDTIGSEQHAWWQGAVDIPHRSLLPLPPEDKVALFGGSAVHPGGRLLANHAAEGIVLGDLATGQQVGFLPVGKGSTLKFDATGNLYGYISNQLHCWPITREGNRFKIGPPERLNLPIRFSNMDLSPDGRFVSQATYNAGAVVLDRQIGKTTLLQPQRDVRNVAVHPNGSLVASFSWNAKGFRVWQADSGKLVHANDQGEVVIGVFTPDGKYLITRAVGIPELQLWSVPDIKLVRTLGARGVGFAISPDSRYVAAAEEDGKVRLSRIDTGAMIARFDTPGEDYLADIYFSPDGRYLFGMNIERTKHHVWDLWMLRRLLREVKLDWETTPVPEPAAEQAPIVLEIAEAALKAPAKAP